MPEIEIPSARKLPRLQRHCLEHGLTYGLDSGIASAKYLRIIVSGPPERKGVFEVDPVPRPGAGGTEIHLKPDQLGLKYNDCVKALA